MLQRALQELSLVAISRVERNSMAHIGKTAPQQIIANPANADEINLCLSNPSRQFD